MRGLINIQVSDVNTGEIVDSREQKNIITNNFLRAIIQNNTLNTLSIFISNAIYKPSVYPTRNLSDNATLGLSKVTTSSLIPGVAKIIFVDKTASSAAYIQLSARFAPPTAGQTRTIKTAALTNNTSNGGEIMAYSELATPCVQTDSQVYDIYYRIMLDYVESDGTLSEEIYLNIIKDLTTTSLNICQGTDTRWNRSPFPKLKQKLGDRFVEIPLFNWGVKPAYHDFDTSYSTAYPSSAMFAYAELTPSAGFNFNNNVGYIIASIKNNPSTNASTFIAKSTVDTNVFKSTSKIQNLFGFKVDSTNPNSLPFLDVDNLAQGSGTLTTGGVWNNNKEPQVPGMYAKTLMPKRAIVSITGSGGVGVGTYKYTERTYIGGFSSGTGYSNWNPVIEVQGLSSRSGTTIRGANNKGLLGNVSDGSFGAQQISASISYDGTSVLIPKKNKVLLYSIAGSEYWFITGAFTNIHQLAVVNGVVYIACKETGLYSVDPRVGLSAQLVSVSGNLTPDFTACYGVAEGYNNSLWAVGKNAIAKYENSSWTVYDSTTSPAFGSDNSHYSRIEYLVVDKTSVNHQMLLVYKPEYTTTKLGLWWSLTTALTNTGDQPALGNFGRPKFNRKDVGAVDGYWFVVSNNSNFYNCAFNAAAFTLISGLTLPSSCRDTSVVFVKKDNVNYLHTFKHDNTSNVGTNHIQMLDNFTLPNGTISYQNTVFNSSSLSFNCNASAMKDNQVVVSSPTVNGYNGYYDNKCNIMLDDGIMFYISKISFLGGEDVSAYIYQIGLNNTMHGGAFRDITRKNYGWNGTAWELNHPGTKTIHNTQEPLLDGVTLAFANGATGTSFVSGNLYAFGLCDGLLKDNATRAQLRLPAFLSKVKSGVAELSSPTVPVTTNLGTGVVGINQSWKSKDVFLDSANSNRVTFPGNTPGEFAVGDIQLSGDFEIRIPCTHVNNALINRISSIGIGDVHVSGCPTIEMMFYENTLRFSYFSDSVTPSSKSTLYDATSIVSTDVFGLKRTGEVFTVTKNGTTVATLSSVTIPALFAKKKRYHILHHKGWEAVQTYTPINCFCPLVTVITNGSDNVVKIGNEVNGTEHFDLNCKGITNYAPVTAKLDGIPAVVRTDNSAVVAGEVGIDLEGLYLYFNPADFGKTIELDCTRYWNK